MSRLRVINLGLPKSGTTTFARALKLSGLKTADYRIRKRQTDDKELHNAFVGQLLYQGYFHTGDPLAFVEEFDGFAELNVLREGLSLWPQADWGLLSAIQAHHPGVKFVSTWREPRAISDSMLRWSNLGIERLPKYGIPGLPEGFGETSAERITWIKGHYALMDRLFQDDLNYLRLDVAAPDAHKKLSQFLGRDLPWWGRANRNPKSKGQEAA
ncbi:MAG: sulfotransferase family protein [Thalassovita sp.]